MSKKHLKHIFTLFALIITLISFQNCNSNFHGGDSYEGLDVGDRSGGGGIGGDNGHVGDPVGGNGSSNGYEPPASSMNYTCIPAHAQNPIELLEIKFSALGGNKLNMILSYRQSDNVTIYEGPVTYLEEQDQVNVNLVIKETIQLNKIEFTSNTNGVLYYNQSTLNLFCN